MFAYVGGTYFFLVGSLNFVARLLNIVITKAIGFMTRKSKPHMHRIMNDTVKIVKKREKKDEESSDDELLGLDEEKDELLPSKDSGGKLTSHPSDACVISS